MSLDFDIHESNLIKDVWILRPSVNEDLRGNIWTSFLKDEVEKLIPDNLYFKHDKFSSSKKNVLRGIHGDSKSWKLVTCVFGEILQVVVDLREGSSTYLKWQSFKIDSNNQQSVLIPPQMGNAYYVYSDNALYHYKLAYSGSYLDAKDQFSLKWNDDRIGIDWPISNPILSLRDR
jgi:dTDP-4-dehydrorhamnose 3,5-epimerase